MSTNVISKAVADLKFRIPKRILEEAFKDDPTYYSYRTSPVPLDEQIMNKVIKSRVLVDCDLVGGTESLVSLDGLSPIITDQITLVYHIPKSRTQNRSIMSALSVGYVNFSQAFNSTGIGTVSPQSINDVLNTASAVFNSHASIPPISTSNVTLIAENTIMVRDVNRIVTNNYLRCILGNDENLNHISFRSIPAFCKLVELAVKSYIYNEMMIKMGETFLSGGQDLGVIKTTIESYADSEQMYQEYLMNTWSKVAFMNDRISMNRFVKLHIGSVK